MPPHRQRVCFAAVGPAARCLMDSKPFGRGPQTQWLPWPGRHVVQLTTTGGTCGEFAVQRFLDHHIFATSYSERFKAMAAAHSRLTLLPLGRP
ncbi:MAG: hypothetical protein ABIN37_01700 [Burkholderiaceae bacterium]